MALKQTVGRRIGMTAAAWLVGFLIFFPILWTISDQFQNGRGRRRDSTAFPVL